MTSSSPGRTAPPPPPSASSAPSALPLAGRRILVTRPAAADDPLNGRLRALGADVITAPSIRFAFAPLAESTPLDRCLADPAVYDWMVLTSRTALRAVLQRPAWAAIDPTVRPRVAAVGPGTAAACREAGLAVALTTAKGTAADLAARLADAMIASPDAPNPRALFPRADIADPALAAALRAAGWRVDDVEAYRTLAVGPTGETLAAIAAGIDAAAFASPSAVRALMDGLAGAARRALAATVVVCIGPTTAAAAEAAGLTVAVVARERSADGIVRAVAGALAAESKHGLEEPADA